MSTIAAIATVAFLLILAAGVLAPLWYDGPE